MDKNYLENIKILRQKIPVGVTHALKTLETTDGNIERAELLIKEEYINSLIEKTGVSKEMAQQFLIKNKFNVETSLNDIEKQIYSSTQLIIKRSTTDKRYGIELILDVIEKRIEAVNPKDRELTIDDWFFNFELLHTLDPYLFCFATIAEWLLYEDCEGFRNAVHFYTEVVTEQIEKILYLPDIANYIRICRERDSYFNEKYKHRKNGFITAHNQVSKDLIYKQAEKGYHDNEKLLIETLYNYTKTHINHFP